VVIANANHCHQCFIKTLTARYSGARHWGVWHGAVSEIELLDDVPDWLIAKQGQADHQPDHAFGGQAPTPQ